MFKNVAGQVVAAQMVSRSDGSDLTSGVSVNVLKDGATVAAGGGTATHEGSGLWSYAPTQAETNGDHLVFQFVHATGVSQAVQIYTTDKAAADALNASAKTIGYATVGSGSSSTSVVCSAVNIAGSTSVGTNALAGRQVLFRGDTTTANLRGAGARITQNTSGSTPTLTLNSSDALPASPASGDVFAIL